MSAIKNGLSEQKKITDDLKSLGMDRTEPAQQPIKAENKTEAATKGGKTFKIS
ncbi:MAG: hypothetical protein QME44_01750 [Thermodesulfobacteriota bacterium]|nr:hypothetical protein [Thermodesulfobacteriota bacterium]